MPPCLAIHLQGIINSNYVQKLCRIINWTFHKFCNWNWQGSSHRTGPLLLLHLLPLSAAKRLYSPSLTLSTSLAALAVLSLSPSLAFDTITKQQLRIYGWQLLGFVLLLIIVIGTNSDILGAPTPRLSELICCPGTESSSPSPFPCSPAPISRFDGIERCVRRIINIRKRKYIFYCRWPAAVFDYCPGRDWPGLFPVSVSVSILFRFAVNCYWQRKQQCGTNWALNLRLALRSLARPFPCPCFLWFPFFPFLFSSIDFVFLLARNGTKSGPFVVVIIMVDLVATNWMNCLT